MNRRRFVLAALFALLAIPALALDYKLGAIEINHPWTRATPPTAQAGGGFLLLTNTGTTPDRLIAVKSPAADKVEIHEMKMDGNVMRMRELDKGIELPPGAGATDLKRQRHLLAEADLILVMTEEQRRMLTVFPEATGKPVLTLRELAGESGDIADPSMQDEDVFRRCRDEITRCLVRGLERLLAG